MIPFQSTGTHPTCRAAGQGNRIEPLNQNDPIPKPSPRPGGGRRGSRVATAPAILPTYRRAGRWARAGGRDRNPGGVLQMIGPSSRRWRRDRRHCRPPVATGIGAEITNTPELGVSVRQLLRQGPHGLIDLPGVGPFQRGRSDSPHPVGWGFLATSQSGPDGPWLTFCLAHLAVTARLALDAWSRIARA